MLLRCAQTGASYSGEGREAVAPVVVMRAPDKPCIVRASRKVGSLAMVGDRAAVLRSQVPELLHLLSVNGEVQNSKTGRCEHKPTSIVSSLERERMVKLGAIVPV